MLNLIYLMSIDLVYLRYRQIIKINKSPLTLTTRYLTYRHHHTPLPHVHQAWHT